MYRPVNARTVAAMQNRERTVTMISYKGADAVIKAVYDNNQEHVFAYWNELSDPEKEHLIKELSQVDFGLMKRLYLEKETEASLDYAPAPYIPLPSSDREKKEYERAREAGIAHLRQGKVAAFIVAGGQGSRLGYEGPKGKFPVGPVSNQTLFQIHGEKILKYSRKYGVSIPWLVMTSDVNHAETVAYFKEQNWFGLPRADVLIFQQNMIPSLDLQGKLVLQSKSSLFMNPDGHGGSLTALATSGALAEMKKRGIEIISYFQVDNPLVKIIDPVFIGFHILRDADVSSKAVKKAYPEEKVGVFVEFKNGAVSVVEYSDLPKEKVHLADANGNLLFSSGSIAIHLFRLGFIERLTAGKEISLPFHTARKKIKAIVQGAPVETEGLKFEKFVFDALPLTKKNVVFETIREEEFAPVKNATGVDSVETAQDLMMRLHREWLAQRHIPVPAVVRRIEISPLAAVEPADLGSDLKIPERESVFIEK